MANNKKSRAKSVENKRKAYGKIVKTLVDIDKVLCTGEHLQNHFIPRGQAFTRKPE